MIEKKKKPTDDGNQDIHAINRAKRYIEDDFITSDAAHCK